MKKYSKDDIGKVEPVEGQSCMYKLSTAFGIRKKKWITVFSSKNN